MDTVIISLLVLLALFLILFIVILVQGGRLKKLNRRLDKFMRGTEAGSLEEEIAKIFADNTYLKKVSEENRHNIKTLFRNFESAFQKVGLVKYDALNQMGGKLSFSLALLDEKDNGFVLNSVHSNDGSYCYAKEITKGSCKIELGKEEKEALNIAMGEKNV